MLGGGAGHGVLLDNGEQVGLVLQVGDPEGIYSGPGWGKVFTF